MGSLCEASEDKDVSRKSTYRAVSLKSTNSTVVTC